MTSIIWHIYQEFLKKEKAALEVARKKARERLERIRRNSDTGPPPGEDGSGRSR